MPLHSLADPRINSLPASTVSALRFSASASNVVSSERQDSREYESASNLELSGIGSCDAVVRYLISCGGVYSWREFCSHFNLPVDTSFRYLEKHLKSLESSDTSYCGQHPQFIHGLCYSDGRSHRFPDAVHMFRFVRLCATWRQNRGRCDVTCDHLHVCREWLVGECRDGPNCPIGHSFAFTAVARLPFPPDWTEDDLRRFLRECHPSVCADYNSPAGCHRQCNRLHLRNDRVLLRCRNKQCTRTHDSECGSCFPVYKRYGLQDLSLGHL